jgi:hypothetical protein
MTQLADPACISQLSEGALGWNVCGEAECWSILEAFGWSVSLTTLTQLALQLGALGNGETSQFVLVALLAHFVVPSHAASLPLAQSIPQALARRHRLIVVVTSDALGNPTPGGAIRHWLGPYGDSGGIYPTLNTLGQPPGLLHPYGQAQLQACDGQVCVEVDAIAPADTPPPSPPPPPQETKMLIVFWATVTNGPSTGINAAFVGDGIHFRWIATEQQLKDILNGTGPAFNGKAVQQWNTPPAPAAVDVGAFGTPANATTAAMLGLPFP